jgi:hypothetical protein
MRAKLIRQIYFVARLDLENALRSRRAQAVLLLHAIFSMGATYVFCRIVQAAQKALDSTARLSETLARDPRVCAVVTALTGDAGIARRLVATPPLTLFFGWISLTFLPFVVVVTSSEAIAAQVCTGEARFVVFRAGRLPYALGTLASHALLLMLGLVLGAMGTLLLGSVMLGADTFFADAYAMVWVGTGAWCYLFAYLGLAMGISQVVSTASAARGMGMAAWLVFLLCWTALWKSWLAEYVPEELLAAVRWFLPHAHSLRLWRLTFAERLAPKAALVFLGALYFLPGWLYFRRRDL